MYYYNYSAATLSARFLFKLHNVLLQLISVENESPVLEDLNYIMFYYN